MSSGRKNTIPPFLQDDDDPEDTLDPALDRMGTLVYRDGEVSQKSSDEPTNPLGRLEQGPDGSYHRREEHPTPTPTPPLSPVHTPYPPVQSPFAPQNTPYPPAQSPFAPQGTPFPMANRPMPPSTGAFNAVSHTPAHGAPQPGFHSQPGFHPQPGFQTGPLQAISPLQQPGFQPQGFQPPPGKHYLKPPTLPDEEVSAALRVRFALAGLFTGGFVGGVMGILNAKMQGWTISQGSSETLTLMLAVAVLLGIAAFLRPDRVEEVLVRYGVLKMEETEVFGKKTGAFMAIPSPPVPVDREDDTLP